MFNKVTLSGKICSGKSTLVQQLHEKLNWPIQSTGAYFRKYAKEHNLSILTAEEQNEEISKKVDYAIRDTLRAEGNIIIDAWMGGIMAQGIPDVFKVLLICDEPTRIKRYQEREGISEEQAHEEVHKRDENLIHSLSSIYKRDDILDPNLYNIVIDTSQTSIEDAVDMIFKAIHGKK